MTDHSSLKWELVQDSSKSKSEISLIDKTSNKRKSTVKSL